MIALLATRWTDGLPWGIAGALFGVAGGLGLVHAGQVRRAPPGTLELLAGHRARWSPAQGAEVEGLAAMHEQWPVTTVRFAASGTTVVFWPDTLCAPGRRVLRLWARSATPASPLPQFWMG